jgi:hypothetical protein
MPDTERERERERDGVRQEPVCKENGGDGDEREEGKGRGTDKREERKDRHTERDIQRERGQREKERLRDTERDKWVQIGTNHCASRKTDRQTVVAWLDTNHILPKFKVNLREKTKHSLKLFNLLQFESAMNPKNPRVPGWVTRVTTESGWAFRGQGLVGGSEAIGGVTWQVIEIPVSSSFSLSLPPS